MLQPLDPQVAAIVEARHGDPFSYLGMHRCSAGVCVRAILPDAQEMAVLNAATGEIVAKVAAVGLNFFILITAGKYQVKPPFPFSPGGEFSGTVESVGAGVTALKPGDRIMGFTNYGAAAERVAVSTDRAISSQGRLIATCSRIQSCSRRTPLAPRTSWSASLRFCSRSPS